MDHVERRTRLGATDVAAIMGVSPWKRPYDVWLEKTDQVEPWVGNQATRLGQNLESALIQFAQEDLGILYANVVRRCEAYPFIGATLDAQVAATGEPVEIKTAGLTGPIRDDVWGEAGTDEVPDYYLVQVHTQLLCTGADRAYLYALIGGRGMVRYEIAAVNQINDMISETCREWWTKHIINGEHPQLSDTDAHMSLDTLKRVRRAPESVIAVGAEVDDLADRLEVAKHTLMTVESSCDWLKAQLIAALGQNECGTLPSGRKITYVQQTRKASVTKESTFRVLRIK